MANGDDQAVRSAMKRASGRVRLISGRWQGRCGVDVPIDEESERRTIRGRSKADEVRLDEVRLALWAHIETFDQAFGRSIPRSPDSTQRSTQPGKHDDTCANAYYSPASLCLCPRKLQQTAHGRDPSRSSPDWHFRRCVRG
jgi:hypothetical protein